MAGWVRLRGSLQVPLRGPAQPLAAVRSGACEAVLRKQSALTHVSSVAACSCALSCAHGKTGVGPPAQLARGMPRAHAAHAPSTGPTPPSTDSREVPTVAFCRAEPCSAQIFPISKYSISMKFHPRMAWIYLPSPGNYRGWGGVGLQDRWRHGWRHRAPWTGLRRVLKPHTAPPSAQHSQSRFLLLLRLLAGAGCNPAEPPHSATCSTCRGSGLVSGSCQKIIVEVRVIAPTHRNVACSAAVALLLSR